MYTSGKMIRCQRYRSIADACYVNEVGIVGGAQVSMQLAAPYAHFGEEAARDALLWSTVGLPPFSSIGVLPSP
jgi:hypothetical protein